MDGACQTVHVNLLKRSIYQYNENQKKKEWYKIAENKTPAGL